jgi:hypothetical protein
MKKALSVVLLALALTACAPSDPTAKNAAFAAGICSQNAEQVWNATDAGLQAELTAMAEFYGITTEALVANSLGFSDGVKCDGAKYVGSYVDRDGNAASIYIMTFTTDSGTWSIFYVLTSTASGVSGVD